MKQVLAQQKVKCKKYFENCKKMVKSLENFNAVAYFTSEGHLIIINVRFTRRFSGKGCDWMKIEKVSENQIRCTLTKEDLADRQIKLSELAYGSEKAKKLFRDMMQQANYEFGFEAGDIPLMVEAIPLSGENIILQITKVEYPEELDTRFSRFTEADEDSEPDNIADTFAQIEKGATDILDMFHKIREEHQKNLGADKEKEGEQSEGAHTADSSVEATTPEVAKENEAQEDKAEEASIPFDMVKLFQFGNMNQIERVAHVLSGYYAGENDLYKDEVNRQYYLMIHKSEHTPEQFNKVCNIMSEYGMQRNYAPAVGAHFEEHEKLILKGNALEVLAQL